MVLDFSISIELYEKLYKYNIINEYYNDDNNEIFNLFVNFVIINIIIIVMLKKRLMKI